ncbi:hypothetical protein AB0B94_30825 [Micromonospora sp. NPDC048986]|uniref:hypothetical protein n=1 Tax=Micromonospora sp. NPDC048986 TaxID=3155644 RepID=UPI0033C1AE53
MAAKIYEIKAFKSGREVRELNPFLTGLDFDNAEVMSDLLNRHLRGAALRDRAKREEIHLYHLEAREVDQYGKGRGQVLFRWMLPAETEVE